MTQNKSSSIPKHQWDEFKETMSPVTESSSPKWSGPVMHKLVDFQYLSIVIQRENLVLKSFEIFF